jgi:16S rRNA (guanine966-N2)-methyltransferase
MRYRTLFPYLSGSAIQKGLGEKALQSAARQGWIVPDALIIWEEGSDVSPPDGFSILDQRKFGDTQATFLRYAE